MKLNRDTDQLPGLSDVEPSGSLVPKALVTEVKSVVRPYIFFYYWIYKQQSELVIL
jgi:hypothetical protein